MLLTETAECKSQYLKMFQTKGRGIIVSDLTLFLLAESVQ